jgi:hypothetical protein
MQQRWQRPRPRPRRPHRATTGVRPRRHRFTPPRRQAVGSVHRCIPLATVAPQAAVQLLPLQIALQIALQFTLEQDQPAESGGTAPNAERLPPNRRPPQSRRLPPNRRPSPNRLPSEGLRPGARSPDDRAIGQRRAGVDGCARESGAARGGTQRRAAPSRARKQPPRQSSARAQADRVCNPTAAAAAASSSGAAPRCGHVGWITAASPALSEEARAAGSYRDRCEAHQMRES